MDEKSARMKGKDSGLRGKLSTGKALLGETGKKRERKKQRLSSQNPKLKRPKGSENSGGQKVNGEKRKRKEVEPREARKHKPESKGEPEEAAAEIEPGRRRKEIADEACMKLSEWKLERAETTVSCEVV